MHLSGWPVVLGQEGVPDGATGAVAEVVGAIVRWPLQIELDGNGNRKHGPRPILQHMRCSPRVPDTEACGDEAVHLVDYDWMSEHEALPYKAERGYDAICHAHQRLSYDR